MLAEIGKVAITDEDKLKVVAIADDFFKRHAPKPAKLLHYRKKCKKRTPIAQKILNCRRAKSGGYRGC